MSRDSGAIPQLVAGKSLSASTKRSALRSVSATCSGVSIVSFATSIAPGIKDVILPGEMKEILNGVVLAEKQAQASVIRRREEANATRSQLNTAKLIEDNPVLMRLKELEALEKVTEKIDTLTVFGGLDGVLKQLVTIR